MALKDYSDYLNLPGTLENEEFEWERQKFYVGNAAAVRWLMESHDDLELVLEIACGAGGVASELTDYAYVGVDANLGCLELARRKRPHAPFILADIRDFQPDYTGDVVCAFAFLKHFGLHEWDDILANILQRGRYAVFAVAIAEQDMDDGKDWHHTHVTREHLERAVKAAGHEIIRFEKTADSIMGYEANVWTKRTA